MVPTFLDLVDLSAWLKLLQKINEEFKKNLKGSRNVR